MRRILLVALLIPFAALADDAKGLWRQTGYTQDETGKRTPCVAGFCGGVMPQKPGLDTLCASAADLQGYAHQHLAQIAMMFRSRMHNCKDTADGVSCDEGRMTQVISPPDASHVEFSFTTQGGGHRMTQLSHYERLGDDCSTANGALRQRP